MKEHADRLTPLPEPVPGQLQTVGNRGGHTRGTESSDFVFVTSKYPFPADDGQKIPIAGLVEALRAEGMAPEIFVASRGASAVGFSKRLCMLFKRFNPFAGFAALEDLPEELIAPAQAGGNRICFVSPARLLDLVLATSWGKGAQIVLILNDAKWPMYMEALEYGIGLRRGGSIKDLLKGLFLPFTFLKERHAYRGADVILVQSEREKRHLRRYGSKVVVAPNAIPSPQRHWSGKGSQTLAMQVNFTNRRANKWSPFVRDVWPEIRARQPDFRLEMFGPGNEMPAWAVDVEGVDYVGRVDDLNAYLAEKRALVMPLEHSTGISNTVLRGMSLGMPTVITHSASLGVSTIVRPHDPVFIAQGKSDFVKKTLEAISVQTDTEPRAIHDWNDNLFTILEKLRAS